MDPRRQLVLDEARRTVDQQVKDLDSLRGRASTLATLAVGAGTFVTGVVVNQGTTVPRCSWVGFAALAVAALAGLLLLWPRKFTFSLNVKRFDDRSYSDDADTLIRAAALSLAKEAEGNQKRLNRLFGGYLFGLACLVLGALVLTITLVWS